MATVEFDTVLAQDEGSNATGIYLPFDPKEVFGRARAPVKVTINAATYRTTTAPYGGDYLIPVRKEIREGFFHPDGSLAISETELRSWIGDRAVDELKVVL